MRSCFGSQRTNDNIHGQRYDRLGIWNTRPLWASLQLLFAFNILLCTAVHVSASGWQLATFYDLWYVCRYLMVALLVGKS